MVNFVKFQAELQKSYTEKPMRQAFVLDQYQRLCAGERGSGLSDAALVAWEACKKSERPWKVCVCESDYDDRFSTGGQKLITVEDDSHTIAVLNNNNEEFNALDVANLFAASPKMLEALERYVGKFGNCGETYDIAVAALKLALGGK